MERQGLILIAARVLTIGLKGNENISTMASLHRARVRKQ